MSSVEINTDLRMHQKEDIAWTPGRWGPVEHSPTALDMAHRMLPSRLVPESNEVLVQMANIWVSHKGFIIFDFFQKYHEVDEEFDGPLGFC